MSKLLILFMAVAFEATFSCSNALGFEPSGQDEEEPNQSAVAIEEEPGTAVTSAKELERLIGMGVQGLGAFAGGLAGTGGTWLVAYWMLQDASGHPGLDEAGYVGPALAGLAAGYCAGFPLGSAIGTSLVSKATNQCGSVWWSWVGANLGTVSALIFFRFFGETPIRMFVPGVLAAGPVVGALMGYNHKRAQKGQQSLLEGSSDLEQPRLSYLIPEVEVAPDRISHSCQPTYKLTIARLNF